jgi:hypothetical protein
LVKQGLQKSSRSFIATARSDTTLLRAAPPRP